MSVSLNIVSIELGIERVTENELWIKDKGLRYIFMFKRNKSSVTLYVGVRGKRTPYKPKRPFKNVTLEAIKRFLSQIDDEGIQANLEEIAEKLWEFYEAWEQHLEDMKISLEIEKYFEEKPLATVKTSSGELTILGSDGFTIPLHGGVIRLGRKTFAVTETTYAPIRKPVPTKKGGVVEVETIAPIMVIAEYVNGEFKRIYVEDPDTKIIRVFDRYPVKIEIKSKATDWLPTLLDAETLVKMIEGELQVPSHKEVFDEIIAAEKRFINFEWDERLYSVVAAYVMYTYYNDFFTTAPRLFFLGPYGSGKTRAMITTTYLSRHGFVVLDPSEASVYRSIEAYGPTLGIDESALDEKLLKLIAAGYKKGLKVPRVDKTIKDSLMLGLFETFSPVIMSFTEPPKELVGQRTIIINMFKTSDPNPERRDPEPHDFEDLRRKLYALRLLGAMEVLEAMEKVREDIKDEFTGREFEIWYPILVMAYLGGEEHYRKVYEYAKEDIEKRSSSLYTEERLILAAIEKVLGENNEEEFTASQLQEYIIEILGNEGYTEKQARREWNTVRIGRILARLGIKKKSIRTKVGPRYVYIITREKFEDIAKRYGYKRNSTRSNCSNCSKISEKGESAAHHESDEAGHVESSADSEGTLSEKVTTLTTVTTNQGIESRNIQLVKEEKLGIHDAIIEIVRTHEKITDVKLYYELERMLKEGKVVPAPLDWDILNQHIEYLEERGKLKRVYDEREDREYLVLGDNQ